MSHSYKRRGEFGIREIRYVSYPYAVVGEIDICFSPNRVQQASYPMPHSHTNWGEFGLRAIRYVSYPYAVVGEVAKHFHLIVFNGHLILCWILIKVWALGVTKQWLVVPLLRDIHKKRRQEHSFLSA